MKTPLEQHPSRPHRRRPGSAPGARLLRRLVLCTTLSVIGLPIVTTTTAQAETAPVPLVTQIADEPVSVGAAQFRRDLFAAADAARLSDPGNTADLLAERVLQHVYALDPQADPAAAATAVRGLIAAATSVTGRAFDARITRTMVLFQGAATADGGPLAATLQRATTEVVALTAHDVTAVAADTHAENALGTTGDTESRLLASPTFTPTTVLRDSAALADRSPGFASARDLVWASATGASVAASSEVLLSTAPALVGNADVQALAGLRDSAGNLETTGRVIAGTPGGSTPHTIESAMGELSLAVDTTRQAAEDSTGPGQVDPATGTGAVEDARDAQTTLALQTGFLTGGTSAAKDIVDQVGAAAVQATLLAMAFNDFSAGNIGRAALSGNAIGVVMTLLPGVLDAAGVFGPSVDDLIMTQLDNISQQLADFQNAVNGQFTQVFVALGGVSDQVTDISRRLDRAVIDIQQARVQIGQVYDSLTQLQGSLDAVQNNLLEALRNGTNSQLRQTINSALGYQDRNGSPLPLNDFNNAAAYLHTFATVTARHSPELNTDHPSFDLQDDANQLSTGIASNVDFLDQLPSKRGYAPARLSGTTGDEPQLANLDDFVLASRAYAQLMLENPRYVSTGYRRWLSDIQALGGPLATLTSAISTPDTTTGTRSTLVNHLVCARTSAAFTPTTTPACQEQTEDTTPVDQLVDQAVRELAGTMPGYDGAGNQTPASSLSTTSVDSTGTRVSDHRFDPFVDAATDSSDLSLLWPGLDGRKKVQQCGAVDGEPAGPRQGEMDRPASLTPASQGVPEVFSWADRMGLGKLDVCWKSTPRTINVNSCLITDLMVVNRLSPSECAITYLRSGVSKVYGTATQVQYRYDDTAFVWTFTPQKPAGPTIYVQSLVRHGAADTSAVVGGGRSLVTNLPGGGYLQSGTTATFISDVDLTGGTDADYTLKSSPRTPAVMYGAPADAAAVARRWGNATTATPGTDTSSISSYQAAASGAVAKGDVLDQAVPGLDPKLGSATAKYARTCTASDAPATCVSGTGTTSIVSTTAAAQAVDGAFDATLVGLQGSIYRKLLSGTQTQGSTTSGPLHDALVRVDGANAMLSSYLQLGAGTALRRHDLTSLPGSLPGSKALVSAMKAQAAGTSAGRPATAPGRLVPAVLAPGALTALDGLFPLPSSASGRTAAAAGPQAAGPVQPALLSTNDQLTLTAIALGAPPSPAPPASTPTTAPTPAPAVTPAPVPAVRIVLGRAPARRAEVEEAYKSRVTATGGAGTYRWARQGRLPLGMTGRATRSGSAYVLKGWPQKTGTYTFSLTATDVSGASTTRSYRIRVR